MSIEDRLSNYIRSGDVENVKNVLKVLENSPDDVRKSVLSQKLDLAVTHCEWNISESDKKTEILRLLLEAGADPNFIVPIVVKPIDCYISDTFI
jgi:hypothetical protein